jgi:hypothetical protein
LRVRVAYPASVPVAALRVRNCRVDRFALLRLSPSVARREAEAFVVKNP